MRNPVWKKMEFWVKTRVQKGTLLYMLLKSFHYIITLDYKGLYLPIYRYISKSSIFIFEEELHMASSYPQKLLDKTIELMHPQSVLDLGCGTGKSLDYFISKGIDAIGVEGSKIAISKAIHPECIIQFNLEQELNLNKKYDLVWSYEFVEHIHPKYVLNLLKTFSNHSDRIVVSCAPPGQGGDGHFNEQPCGYWIMLFEKEGYKLDKEKTDECRAVHDGFSENILVFERQI